MELIRIQRNRGFTLVEMAVVLVIVGLMIGGLVVPLTAQMDQKSRGETLKSLEEAKEALIGYTLVNKYLPCPDANPVPTGVAGGRDAGGNCTTTEGVLPWQTLGITRTDVWDRYFRYRMTPEFSNSMTFFSLGSTGGITINSDTGTLATTAVAVIISHGKNGYGAINTTQSNPDNIMPSPAVSATDENENLNLDNTFVSHIPTPQGSANEFDDLVVWVPQTILFNRMVAAGRLP